MSYNNNYMIPYQVITIHFIRITIIFNGSTVLPFQEDNIAHQHLLQ